MILLGIYWFGRAYNIYSTIYRAAQEGAAVAAKSQCGSCGNTRTTAGAVSDAVTAALQASRIDPAAIQTSTLTPAPVACADHSLVTQSSGNISIYRNARLNNSSGEPEECGAIVSFRYPYQMYLPFTSLNRQLITMTATAEMRMEN
jgi:hypothetical protein